MLNARFVSVVAVCALLSACTEGPGSFGLPPAFLILGDAQQSLTNARLLPADSCPTIPAPDPAWTRRALPESSGTIALPASMLGATAGFGARPGIVFNAATQGVVAVTFDADIATVSVRSELNGFALGGASSGPFDLRCQLSIDGVPATLYLNSFTAADLGLTDPFLAASILYENQMVLSMVTPAGRRMHAVAIANPGVSYFNEGAAVLSLLSVATTIQWP